MSKILIILCPPRSFSSVISTMIGQHPELYGFPELFLFSYSSVGEMIKSHSQRGKVAPPGLIRTLAQEHDGVQSQETIMKEIEWLVQRKDWSTQKLFGYLTELISPKIGVEKTPSTCRNKKYLERAFNWFPSAYFLHLTRHPVSTSKSMSEFFATKFERQRRENLAFRKELADNFVAWHRLHSNILNFTNNLPTGQTIRIKGEDLLSFPDLYLPQIAEWLNIRSDQEAIAAMKHPENSPYADLGAAPCKGGNDPKFMANPRLRQGIVKEPSLLESLNQKQWSQQSILKFNDVGKFEQDILNLAHLLGYE